MDTTHVIPVADSLRAATRSATTSAVSAERRPHSSTSYLRFWPPTLSAQENIANSWIQPHPGRRLRRCCRHLRPVLLQRHPESTARHPAEGPIHWRLLQARSRTGGQPVLDYGCVEVIGLVRSRMKKEAGAWLVWGAVLLYSKRRRVIVRNVQMFR